MRILVCGDRNWDNKKRILSALCSVICPYIDIHRELVLIHGDATGADRQSVIAMQQVEQLFTDYLIKDFYADAETHLPTFEILPFPAPWKDIDGKPEYQIGTRKDGSKFWKGAGPYRNQQMLDEGKPDIVLAFHSDIGNSKGTLDMIKRANKAGIEVRLYGEGK